MLKVGDLIFDRPNIIYFFHSEYWVAGNYEGINENYYLKYIFKKYFKVWRNSFLGFSGQKSKVRSANRVPKVQSVHLVNQEC